VFSFLRDCQGFDMPLDTPVQTIIDEYVIDEFFNDWFLD